MAQAQLSRFQKRKLILWLLAAGLLLSSLLILTAGQLLAGFPQQVSPSDESPHLDLLFYDIQFSSEIIAPELTGQEYFVNFRLEREKFRQEVKGMLAMLLDSPEPDTRALAQKQWLNLTQAIQQEAEIENYLKIIGFTDVVSQVKPGNVEVIVLSSTLTSQQIAEIQKAVTRITGVLPENINVFTRA